MWKISAKKKFKKKTLRYIIKAPNIINNKMAPQVLTEDNIDLSNLELKQVSKGTNNTNYLFSNVLYKTGAKSIPFRFYLKNVSLVLGCSYREEYDTFSCLLQLSESQYEKMNEINQYLAELGVPLFKEASGKKGGNIDSSKLQVSLRGADEEQGYSPSLGIKFKFNKENNHFWCELIDGSSTKLPFTTENPSEFLKRNSVVDCILSCTVYKTGSNYGITWTPSKIRVQKVGEDAGTVSFPDEAELNEQVSELSVKETVKNKDEDLDDEDDDDDDEMVSEILKSKPKKSSVRH